MQVRALNFAHSCAYFRKTHNNSSDFWFLYDYSTAVSSYCWDIYGPSCFGPSVVTRYQNGDIVESVFINWLSQKSGLCKQDAKEAWKAMVHPDMRNVSELFRFLNDHTNYDVLVVGDCDHMHYQQFLTLCPSDARNQWVQGSNIMSRVHTSLSHTAQSESINQQIAKGLHGVTYESVYCFVNGIDSQELFASCIGRNPEFVSVSLEEPGDLASGLNRLPV